MAKQKVTIKETLVRVVEVEASDAASAENEVRGAYRNGSIILDADDFIGVEFTVEGGTHILKRAYISTGGNTK